MGDVNIDLVPDLDALVAGLEEIKPVTLDAAGQIAAAAQASAPARSGSYRAGIRVEETRLGAIVIASDPASMAIEFGVPSRGIPAQFILRRAVAAAGMKFRKK